MTCFAILSALMKHSLCYRRKFHFLPSGTVGQEAEVDELAQKLLCVFATTGQIPIVRCRAGASRTEMIARRLVELVKDQLLMGKGNIFDQKASSVLIAKRPLLVRWTAVRIW